jgi:cytochrome c oxidase subunit 2
MFPAALPLFPDQASSLAGSVDALFFVLIGVAAFFSLLIFALITFFAIRYHRKSETEVAPEIHGSLTLELVWTGIPLVIVLFLFGWGAKLYFDSSRPPANATPIFVVGKQWMWKIEHPEGKSEINELHVPIGQPIRLTMTSEDVIHDFFIPAFRAKMDVVPGRYSSLWFTPTKLGRYHLFCAQYCGTNHSAMNGWVEVMTPADFQRWLSGSPAGETMAGAGEKLVAKFNCMSCHKEGGRGPLLTGIFGRTVTLRDGRSLVADEAYIRESILNPGARVVVGYEPQMPTYQGQLSESQVLQIIAYLKSLGTAKGGK